jgi:hypothetical protein
MFRRIDWKSEGIPMFTMIGMKCDWPMQTYSPADLPAEYHMDVRSRIVRAARWWGLDEEAAEEAGSQFYAHWLARNWAATGIGKGDHARAIASVLAYAKRSHFHGFTGQRRNARGKRVERGADGHPVKASIRKACAAELAMLARLKERSQPTPESVAVAAERIATTPAHSRKAYRLAKRLGLPGVRELVREACGFGVN